MHDPLTYADLIEKITAWAKELPAIRALVIIGSRARTTVQADQYSDLDLLVVADETEPFFQSAAWIGAIGSHWLWFDEPTPVGTLERRVLFDQALDVDFAFVTSGDLEQILATEAVSILQRGYRVLVDKIELTGKLAKIPPAKPVVRPLTEETFANTVKDFWYHAVWCGKKLLRGETWMAKSCLDGYMKRRLLLLVESQAHARHGWDYDTWFDGRFFDTWADPDIRAGIRTTFAHYDKNDIARALFATMDLFRAVARETAERLSFAYPYREDQATTEWVKQHLQRLG